MGHMERYGKHVAINIYGNKHQPIIESGINYFK
jgi:phosphoribosylformylglycinamidine synthase